LNYKNQIFGNIIFLADLITAQIPADRYFEMWIGMQLTRHSNAERIVAANWVDGSPMDYGNPVAIVPGTAPWANTETPEPNNAKVKENGQENCVQIRREGWFDNFCDHPLSGFLCQKLIK
jgi:hypothetical protein